MDVEFIASPFTEGFSSGASVSSQLAVLNWNQLLLYPKGSVIQETTIESSLTLPTSWKFACALPRVGSEDNGRIKFKSVTLERLCDSPILCGEYVKEIHLGPMDGPQHFLCIAADSDAALGISAKRKAYYDRLIAESGALFGARPGTTVVIGATDAWTSTATGT